MEPAVRQCVTVLVLAHVARMTAHVRKDVHHKQPIILGQIPPARLVCTAVGL